MIACYANNPFKDILPSKDPFSAPPPIKLGTLGYVVYLLWDLEILKTKVSDEVYQQLVADGVTAQAKLRDEDGDEHYARIFGGKTTGTQVELAFTGFRGTPPAKGLFLFSDQTQEHSTEEDDMRPIDKLKEFLITNYYEEADQEAVREGLAGCDDYKAVWAYVNWDANLWDEMLEAFFQL